MPTATDTVSLSTAPLTLLSEEEKMFQNTVRRFARERIGPHVREMDEAGAFRKELLQEMFELGLMGIEIPEEYGDHFLITGRKLWITNAAEAGIYFLFANANPEAGHRGITCFIVERGFAGFQVGKKEDKLGIRASSTCELILDACRVPAENVLSEVGKGYKIAIETLNEGRIGIGAQMAGLAQGALDHALAYAKQRHQFGKPIAEFQGVQFELAQMATEVEASRLLVYNSARLRDAGMPFVTEAAMAKYFASQVAETTASRAVEIFGGVGFTKDYPVEKLYRDAKIGRIYEGTSNMQKMTIAKQMLGNRG